MRALATPVCALVLALGAAADPGARFDQWYDPDFEQAVVVAEVIALGTITAHTTEAREMDGHGDAVAVSVLDVERVLAGTVPADAPLRFRRRGRHAAENPTPAVGTRVVVFLMPLERRLADLTPTWGVFPVTDDVVAMPIRDPFARVGLPLADLEAFVRFGRVKTPPRDGVDAWLDRLARRVADTAPDTATLADVEAQVVFAEACARFGRAADVAALTRLLASPYDQVRRSVVRGLGAIGGDAAVDALLAHLRTETHPVVQSALGRALWRRARPADRAALVAAAEAASDEAIAGRRNLMDPRLNDVVAPRTALQAAVRRLDGATGSFAECCGGRDDAWTRAATRRRAAWK